MPNKILVADDSRLFRSLLVGILDGNEYQILEAYDGKDAVDICFREYPDIVLLDIEMPGYDGYKVCEIIKNDNRTKNITVIFLSARTEVSDKITGLNLGAADYITKPFNEGEVLARVKTQLKIRHLTNSLIEANRKLVKRQKALDDDLKAAAEIQQSLIPKMPPKVKNFNFAWRFIPCERVGGDIFNIHRLDESHLAVYIVDVSGHGVPSAMVTVSVSQTLLPNSSTVMKRKANRRIIPPVDVLNLLDQEYPMERFDKYFTITYLILNIHTGQVSYSSAGHPVPVLTRHHGEIELLNAGGGVIGMGDLVPFEEGEIIMKQGDRLFLFTDGLFEIADKSGEFYGEDRLRREFLKHRNVPLDAACEQLTKSLWDHGDGVQPNDDITLLAIEYTGQK
ncbi:MAG: SpoIIE family protein phosphatase [Desulfobacterales bacterium]|nr:SpoIIE family protein phosphatase [Desulfobacterales bacterium]